MTVPPPQRVAAVVVAAGRGERLGTPRKVLLSLADRPMLAWSLAALERAQAIGAVVVVAGAHVEDEIARLVHDDSFAKVFAIVSGGERRQDSVAAGLAALPVETAIVVIHDAARPLAEPELFDRCVQTAAECGAAIAAAPVADTLKRVTDGVIRETVDRTGLWAAQTPQAFRLDLLRQAMAACGGKPVTDDALLCEAIGVPVTIVPASTANLKVTRGEDIATADALLRARKFALTPSPSPPQAPLHWRGESPVEPGERESPGGQLAPEPPVVNAREGAVVRTGIGYDVHRFAPERRLVLGGVEIAHDQGLLGHSDADVLLHAIADAILGAAALGDIGQHFPPADERFRDADSQDLLREAVRLAGAVGWEPAQVDATLLAEAPRVAPHVRLMRERIAACLGIVVDAVSVKATTNEGLGAIGRGEGIAALATATLVPTRSRAGR
jgi:2-C-methyl-D-erythritol 4-phosphate cytidylyltransferase / 2-C-methyl-D-erythritol 2,4-cyclodiphosphate synthase